MDFFFIFFLFPFRLMKKIFFILSSMNSKNRMQKIASSNYSPHSFFFKKCTKSSLDSSKLPVQCFYRSRLSDHMSGPIPPEFVWISPPRIGVKKNYLMFSIYLHRWEITRSYGQISPWRKGLFCTFIVTNAILIFNAQVSIMFERWTKITYFMCLKK